jgi:hypothetical protein
MPNAAMPIASLYRVVWFFCSVGSVVFVFVCAFGFCCSVVIIRNIFIRQLCTGMIVRVCQEHPMQNDGGGKRSLSRIREVPLLAFSLQH